MSVISGKRTEGKLRVLGSAYELCRYTLHIAKNEKIFPKGYRWLLTQKIVDESVDAMCCIKRANAVNVKNHDDYKMRRTWQVEAYAHLEALLGLIDLAFNTLNIEAKRVEHWTGLVLETEKGLVNWGKSDKKRYAELI